MILFNKQSCFNFSYSSVLIIDTWVYIMKEKRTENSVQLIDRTFQTLEFVSKNGSVSLKEIYTSLNINKASISRIVGALCENDYLRRDEKTGNFSLSFRAFEVGVRAVRDISYLNVLRSLLDSLSTELNAVAQFSVDDNDELLCLESFNKNNENLSVNTSVGQRTPLYATSAGKAILSTYTNDELFSKWKKMNIKPLMPNTITNYDDFLREMALVRQRNYATDREENDPGVFCVGTVLLNYNRRAVGAISLSSSSMDAEKEQLWSRTLIERTKNLFGVIGYSTA